MMASENVKRVEVARGRPKAPSRRVKPLIFPIRMSKETIDLLAEVAEWKGVPASTLARMWLLERLAQEREANPGRSRFGEWIKRQIELPD